MNIISHFAYFTKCNRIGKFIIIILFVGVYLNRPYFTNMYI